MNYAAHHDTLKGIYNRAGIMTEVISYIKAHHPNQEFVALMADLDHLKQINDNFGHAEGDRAICSAAEILRAVLPAGSPIGRTGGDEFTAFSFVESGEMAETIKAGIKKACETHNQVSESPYYIGISVGYRLFRGEEMDALSGILKEADQKLYIAKKERRKSVLRNTAGAQEGGNG